MKKSEMIEAIREFNSYDNAYNDDEYAKQLVDFIEGRGMIPPNQYASTNEFRFEWEDEC